MKKTIYDGWSSREPYSRLSFGGFMTRLGADVTEGGVVVENTAVYHLHDVSVVWKYRGWIAGVSFGPLCSVELLGDEDKVSKVEKIILAEQEKFCTEEKEKRGFFLTDAGVDF